MLSSTDCGHSPMQHVRFLRSLIFDSVSWNSIDMLLEQRDSHSYPEARHGRTRLSCLQEAQGPARPYDATPHEGS